MVDLMRNPADGVRDELYSIGRQLARRAHHVEKHGYSEASREMYRRALDRLRKASGAAEASSWRDVCVHLASLRAAPDWDVCFTRVDRSALDSITAWCASCI